MSHNDETQGTLCYVIVGSHPDDAESAGTFQQAIHEQLPDKVILLEKNSHDAQLILSFYAVTDAICPILLVVRDDDSLAYQFSGTLPTVDDLLYRLNQIGN